MPIFDTKASRIKKEMAAAKVDFDRAVDPNLAGLEARQLRRRVANRCRAHFDKTFIEGAEKYALFNEQAEMAKAKGQKPPELPEVRNFILIPALDREIFSYLPQEMAEKIFLCGRDYQSMLIDGRTAVRQMQTLADDLCNKLQVVPTFITLQFLRDELESEEGEDDEYEDDDSDDEYEDGDPQPPSQRR
jgi:hypothetical protein